MDKIIHSYTVTFDQGFAPNPFGGIMTVNTCKPPIRRSAKKYEKSEHWIIGTGSKKTCCIDGKIRNHSGKLIFAMFIKEVITMKEYEIRCNNDVLLKIKIPDWKSNDLRKKAGDCIFQFIDPNSVNMLESYHSNDSFTESEIRLNRKKDLGGINTLISNDFYYFGSDPMPLNEFQDFLHPFIGQKKITDPGRIELFLNWIRQQKRFNELEYDYVKNDGDKNNG